MMDYITQWATLLSPIISVIAIIVALCIARSSSKDAQKQINAIHNLLDVFVAVHNLDIFDAKRKYEKELEEVSKEIARLNTDIDTVFSPFIGGSLINCINEQEEYKKRKNTLSQLEEKRKEIKYKLRLIQNYINKTTK
jgi:hypothetical protein